MTDLSGAVVSPLIHRRSDRRDALRGRPAGLAIGCHRRALRESELGFEPSRSHLNLADAMLG